MMTTYPLMLLILEVVMAMMVCLVDGARVLSGQMVCLGGPGRPCYKIAYFHDVSSRVAFREACQACEMDGGSLLSIESPAEQTDIENLLQELRSGAVGSAGGAGGSGIADSDFWIGLTRVGGGDQAQPELSNTFTSCSQLYHWTDSSPASFRNWYVDEPSCGGEACVVMYHQPTALPGLGGAYLYQWNDDRCNMKHNFICKYRPGMLLVYVIIPTIPLLLLILVASGTCCFQMLSRSSPRTKTAANQSNLWITRAPKHDSMEERTDDERFEASLFTGDRQGGVQLRMLWCFLLEEVTQEELKILKLFHHSPDSISSSQSVSAASVPADMTKHSVLHCTEGT
ncbi:hypothetical protein INR49_029212 [Caranx melampygus]|nr:hypothetical protein INR49_029212 [Caranx melampygus]